MGADKSAASGPALPSAGLAESTSVTESASAAKSALLADSAAASASLPAPGVEAPLDETLCGLLLEGLGALADAGDVEKACRLAGRAYVKFRHENPQQARRFDVLLHRLSRRLDW